MLRIAILGVGWAGTRQVQAVRELGRKVTVDCLVDTSAGQLAEKSEELGIPKTYGDYHEALKDPEVDAVSICLPHNLHCRAAVDAASAGKHILCEKPIAIRVEEATRMIEAAKKAEVRLYVAENLPYTPMSRLLRAVVEEQRYTGNLTSASLVRGFRARPYYRYPGRRAWLASKDVGGGGTWILHGIHSMAQLRYVLGEVQVVYMREHHTASFKTPEIEGTMSGLLSMASGIQVFVVQTCQTRLPPRMNGFAIHGEEGTVCATKAACEVYSESLQEEPLLLDYPEQELSDYALEMEAFADYVAGTAVGPTTGESERRTLAIVQAGYESALTGKPIELKARFGEI